MVKKMVKKFIAKKVQGGWAVFKREGVSRTQGWTDTRDSDYVHGSMHEAFAVAEQMTRDRDSY